MKNDDRNSPRLLFSARERRAILFLLPVLGALSFFVHRASQPRFEENFTAYADAVCEQNPELPQQQSDSTSLFDFDPNTIEFHDLCRLGFSRSQALSIIKFRTAGKTFSIPEDLAACYAVSESMYLALRPHIKISPQHALEKRTVHKPAAQKAQHAAEIFGFMPDTASEQTLQRLGFSPSQARTIINYRTARGGFGSEEEFARCYAVSERMLERLRPYMTFQARDTVPSAAEPSKEPRAKVELNTADSAELRSVRGIGEKTVTEIIAYRERLGGFHCAEQLAEVPGMNERNFERICPQIFIDTCKIRKIDINFAPARKLRDHPYISPATLRRLLKQRQLKGGWRSLEDLLNDNIFKPREAEYIAPYLVFTTENPDS